MYVLLRVLLTGSLPGLLFGADLPGLICEKSLKDPVLMREVAKVNFHYNDIKNGSLLVELQTKVSKHHPPIAHVIAFVGRGGEKKANHFVPVRCDPVTSHLAVVISCYDKNFPNRTLEKCFLNKNAARGPYSVPTQNIIGTIRGNPTNITDPSKEKNVSPLAKLRKKNDGVMVFLGWLIPVGIFTALAFICTIIFALLWLREEMGQKKAAKSSVSTVPQTGTLQTAVLHEPTLAAPVVPDEQKIVPSQVTKQEQSSIKVKQEEGITEPLLPQPIPQPIPPYDRKTKTETASKLDPGKSVPYPTHFSMTSSAMAPRKNPTALFELFEIKKEKVDGVKEAAERIQKKKVHEEKKRQEEVEKEVKRKKREKRKLKDPKSMQEAENMAKMIQEKQTMHPKKKVFEM